MILYWKPVNMKPDSNPASETDPYTTRERCLEVPQTAWCIERAVPARAKLPGPDLALWEHNVSGEDVAAGHLSLCKSDTKNAKGHQGNIRTPTPSLAKSSQFRTANRFKSIEINGNQWKSFS